MIGLPGKRDMAAMWAADQKLVRALMPLLERALDQLPPSAERGELEATYALVMERYLTEHADVRKKERRIVVAR